MKQLMEIAKHIHVQGGAVAVLAGDQTGTIYAVQNGVLSVFEGYGGKEEKCIATLTPGSYFGEVAPAFGRTWPVSIVAVEDCDLLAVPKENLSRFFSLFPEAAVAILDTMKRIFSELHANTRTLHRLYWSGFSNTLPELPPKANENQKSTPRPEPKQPEKAGGARAPAGPGAETPKEAPRPELFPAGHGEYELPIDNELSNYLYDRSCSCPCCGNKFKNLTVRASKLVVTHTDSDMRTHYKDIEPLYYDVITCPNCYYSALSETFENVSSLGKRKVLDIMSAYSAAYQLKFGRERDTFAVFAGYYLALLCAPHAADYPKKITASLWLKLNRLYEDCGDENMRDMAVRMAYADYLYSFENYNYSGQQEQQLLIILGQLLMKMADWNGAMNFLFKAKTSPGGIKAMVKVAEDLVEEIRERRGR